MRTQNLASKLLIPQLTAEVDNILSIVRQGFDLHVFTEHEEVIAALKTLLTNEAENLPPLYILIDSIESIEVSLETDFFLPRILIGSYTLPPGKGFARYRLASPDKILGKPATAVAEILKSFHLESYLDCFDGKTFKKLKEIAQLQGVNALIDAVIQTAFLSGMLGEQEQTFYYLEQFQNFWDQEQLRNSQKLSSCGKRFLSHCISYGDDSMGFLKACLCFYVVDQQGRSMTQASEILNISRTTLSEYLKSAEKLHVSHFFNS